MTYDLGGLRAAVEKATPGDWQHHLSHVYGPDPERTLIAQFINGPWLVSDRDATIALLNAARFGLLDDAALGRAVRAAAERDGPEQDAVERAMLETHDDPLHGMFAAAIRALVAMGGGK